MGRFSEEKSFTLIELLIVTPQRNLLRRFSRGGRAPSQSNRISTGSASSFTLIELLIVIGILAVLVAAVVVVLNPAQLVAQARDSKRQQDLSALTHALNTITALDQTTFFGTSSIVYTSLPDSSSTCGSWGLPALPSGWSYHCVATSSLQNTDGTGWIPVNFKTNGVINLSALPTDPQNTSSTGLYYTYVTGGSFELTAAFESTKYKMGGDSDKASTDGGPYTDLYEVGSNLSLQPLDHGDPSLIGYWKFDEASGTTTYDSSGNGNTGTLNLGGESILPVWVTGKHSGGLQFTNASGKYGNSVRVLNSATIASGFTVALWANYSSSSITIFQNGVGSIGCTYNPIFRMPTQGNMNMAGYVYDSGNTQHIFSSTDTIPLNQWRLLAMAVSPGPLVSFYDNGTLVSQQTGSFALGAPGTGAVIGGSTCSYLAGTYGTFDDVRLWNRTLSASEIYALYNATK